MPTHIGHSASAASLNMKTNTTFSRRQFLARTSAAALAGAVVPQFLPSGILAAPGQPGANDRISVGFIGIGRQGGNDLADLLRCKDAQVGGFADVNLPRAQQNAAKYNAFACQDYRKLLERKDIDAILTATPEQWRILIVLHSLQAGKDMYVEKPMSLTIREGRLMVQATRKYNRILQVGSQQRSDPLDKSACEFVRSGGLGKLSKVQCCNYPSPWEYKLPGEPVPEGLDWNMWCGPAPLVPYTRSLYVPREEGVPGGPRYAAPGWLSFRAHSGGEVTGWGAHGFDMIQYALGMDDTGPVELWPEGDKFNPPTYEKSEGKKRGDGITSNPHVYFKYANGLVVEPTQTDMSGGTFHGEKGWLKIMRGRVESEPEDIAVKLMRERPKSEGSHVAHWLKCIKSRQKSNSDVEIGQRSSTVCHLVNIARWTGRKLKWDPAKEEFIGDTEANQYLDRERRKGFEVPAQI
jgi:predicted dehydrogenase